jgi:hypothetical protein
MHTEARDINNHGMIVGLFFGTTVGGGFITDGATFTPIDLPGISLTIALDLNDYGHIVGWFREAALPETHGFVTDGVTFTPIDVPGATMSSTQPFGINNRGMIVGWFADASLDQRAHSNRNIRFRFKVELFQ